MKARRQEQDDISLCAAYEDETPTPHGWKRKLIPRVVGRGLYSVRTDVVFIAPNGEEFTSKHQLGKYLKVHKASPAMSEFIWTTEDAPRRSTRLTSRSSKQQLPIKCSNINGSGRSKVNTPVSKSKSRKQNSRVDNTKYVRKHSIVDKKGSSIHLRRRYISSEDIAKCTASIVDGNHVSNRNINVKYESSSGMLDVTDEFDPTQETEQSMVRGDPWMNAAQEHFDSSDELSSLFDVSGCNDKNMTVDSMGEEVSTIDQQHDP